MVDNIGSVQQNTQNTTYSQKVGLGKHPPIIPFELQSEQKTDTVSFGSSGSITSKQANGMVYERAMQQLRMVVNNAKAELGITDDSNYDTSTDATANRIADFALGAYSKWAKNNGVADDEAGRKQFSDFIGKAIYKGIDEAKGILSSLSALNGEVTSNIDKITDTINKRLEDFVKNGNQKTTESIS